MGGKSEAKRKTSLGIWGKFTLLPPKRIVPFVHLKRLKKPGEGEGPLFLLGREEGF